MWPASRSRVPVALVRDARSLPAKSIRLRVATFTDRVVDHRRRSAAPPPRRRPADRSASALSAMRDSMLRRKTVCERDERVFMAVAP